MKQVVNGSCRRGLRHREIVWGGGFTIFFGRGGVLLLGVVEVDPVCGGVGLVLYQMVGTEGS